MEPAEFVAHPVALATTPAVQEQNVVYAQAVSMTNDIGTAEEFRSLVARVLALEQERLIRQQQDEACEQASEQEWSIEKKQLEDRIQRSEQELLMREQQEEARVQLLKQELLKRQQQEQLQLSYLDPHVLAEGNSVISSNEGHKKAIGRYPFPNDCETTFVVEIPVLHLNHWVFCGIIAQTSPVGLSQRDSTSYGWAGRLGWWMLGGRAWEVYKSQRTQIFFGGVIQYDYDGWLGWRQGDRAVFRYRPRQQCLQMFHERLDRLFTLNGLPAAEYRLHVNLCREGDKVTVTPASEEDLTRAGFACNAQLAQAT